MLSYRLGTVNDFHWEFKPVAYIRLLFEYEYLIMIHHIIISIYIVSLGFRNTNRSLRHVQRQKCCKQCGQVKFMGTMTKWPVQKHT